MARKKRKKAEQFHFEPSPEWVVLLIPNEGMFRAAVEHDPMLLDTAMQQHVLLASPVTLLALLKAMAHGWQQENRARSVQLIVEHSRTLQQQLKAFITQWRKLHGQLNGTVVAFNQFTTTYQTTILPVIQQICDLDGTINAQEYDLSRTPPLQNPKPIEDLLTQAEEHLTES
jgi:DNA recombination protein RmuC